MPVLPLDLSLSRSATRAIPIEPHGCFGNALETVRWLMTEKRLTVQQVTYVEAMVARGDVAILHAWVEVDGERRVDPTWLNHYPFAAAVPIYRGTVLEIWDVLAPLRHHDGPMIYPMARYASTDFEGLLKEAYRDAMSRAGKVADEDHLERYVRLLLKEGE